MPARRSIHPVVIAALLLVLCRGAAHAQDAAASTRHAGLSPVFAPLHGSGLAPLGRLCDLDGPFGSRCVPPQGGTSRATRGQEYWKRAAEPGERLRETPPPQQQPSSQGVPGAARDRRWEIEVHGGWVFNDRRRSGSSALPSTGAVVGGQISITSFFFGEGPRLFNQNQSAIPGSQSTIAPLDSVLLGSSLQWQRNIGTVGVRISRRVGRRFTVEVSGDYDRTALALTNSAPDNIEATRVSVEQALGEALSTLGAPAVVSTSATLNERIRGTQLSATGAFLLHVRETARLTPYLAVGGGAIFNRTNTPSVTLSSRYQLGASDDIVGTDSVRLRYSVRSTQYIGLVGGGLKYRLSPRWGVRVDARARVYPNRIANLVDATPAVVLRSTGSPFPRVDVAALQFSSTAPLTGAPISNATTFTTSGLRAQVGVAAGLILRF